MTNVYGDDIGSGGFRTGYLAGGWMRIPMGGVASIQLEANFAQKGFKESANGQSAGLELSYLDLPVLIQLTKREHSIQGVFSLGGALSLQRGCRASVSAAGLSAEIDCSALNEYENVLILEDWAASIVMGTAVEFNSGPLVFGLAFRAQVGATDALSVLIDDVELRYGQAKNGAFELQATVGVPLRL